MEILYSALIGCFFGAICAGLETVLMLMVVKRAGNNAAADIAAGVDAEEATQRQAGMLMKTFILRYFINVMAILAIFLLRGMLPYKWEYILLFFGVSLVGVGQLLLIISGLRDRLSSGRLF